MAIRPIDANALHAEISKWPEPVMYKDCVQSAIATAPTLTPPNEWVSVEDRLPPPNVRVLAYRPGEGDNSPYKYTNMWGWAVKESIRHKGITHWMYYPAPPDRRPPEGEA